MLFLLPALALTALGLGVKHALEGDLAFAPADTRWRGAWCAHRDAVRALREARTRLRTQALALGALQERAVEQTARPFLELVERLERWECLTPEDRLAPSTRHALQALTGAAAPQDGALARALLAPLPTPPPASLAPLLAWLERGWVHVETPVRVGGVSVFEAVSAGDFTPGVDQTLAHAQRLEAACAELAQLRAYVEALEARAVAHAARLADLEGCASAQLASLDAQAFEGDCESSALPRARLRRLASLMGALTRALQQPLLERSGALGLGPTEVPLPSVEQL